MGRYLVTTAIALAAVSALIGAAAASLPSRSGPRAGRETSAEIVGQFNAIRVGNGLPPVTNNKVWDVDCRYHDLYMSDNATETHFEQPDKPGYTRAGALAGRNADLAPTSWADGDPWANAHFTWYSSCRARCALLVRTSTRQLMVALGTA